MEIKSNERLFITGATNSGKSYWLKKQIPQLERFIFYDPKCEHNDIDAILIRSIPDLKLALEKGVKKIVYRPFFLSDEIFEGICEIAWYEGNITLVIDEIADHSNSSKISSWHSVLMRMGRTKGVGVWNCTQRPRACLHNTILSETTHIICFSLFLETDRKKLTESFNELFYEANTLDKWNYIYFHVGDKEARIMPPI